jgi:ketosteroid isomerase-like protein
MPESNLERTRRGVDAFSRGDLSAWIEMFDEDVVWVPAEIPDLQTVTGRVGVLELMQSYLEPWDRLELETLELEQHGEAVLWTAMQTLSQKDSGLSFDTEVSAVLEYRDGLIKRVCFYWDRAEARKAIGLAK